MSQTTTLYPLPETAAVELELLEFKTRSDDYLIKVSYRVAMQLPVYYLDAFTKELFAGNPAAVCPLEKWLPDALMQSIAAENNLAETAFFVPRGHNYEIRWFTPTVEIDLCGHATLASAYVLFEYLGYSRDSITFHSNSGDLMVSRGSDKLTLDFPGLVVEPCNPTAELLANFDKRPVEVLISGSGTYTVVVESEDQVHSYIPDFQNLSMVDRCVNITAPGKSCHFVSRFFGPNIGIPEDPVTGSAHFGLAIYWSKRLVRTDELHARQLSARTGEVFCRVAGDRVLLSGSVVPYMHGKITLQG